MCGRVNTYYQGCPLLVLLLVPPSQAAQLASFEAWKAEETKQLANRRRVLDQQYKVRCSRPQLHSYLHCGGRH